jgi:uncharacterized membrane protein YheB (UPF0754 family)
VGFIELIQSDYTVLLIPVISAFIGWFTNWLAVQMMFYPNDFVGIPPFLGWQGIVPASAERLARFSTRLITTKLLSLEELFQNFKGDAFASEMDAVVDQITEQILQEVAQKHAKVMWENAGEVMQNMVRQKLREEVRTVVINITDDFSTNITKILDLEQVVLDAVMKNRRLMTMMFLEVGEAEFKFIIRSGIWFGFLFGIPQMIIWVVWPAVWVLPFFGFLVGYATNWIALKLVFEPQRPVKIGPFVLQGLFHKRQQVVAERFSELTAGHLLNAENIVRTVTGGRVRQAGADAREGPRGGADRQVRAAPDGRHDAPRGTARPAPDRGLHHDRGGDPARRRPAPHVRGEGRGHPRRATRPHESARLGVLRGRAAARVPAGRVEAHPGRRRAGLGGRRGSAGVDVRRHPRRLIPQRQRASGARVGCAARTGCAATWRNRPRLVAASAVRKCPRVSTDRATNCRISRQGWDGRPAIPCRRYWPGKRSELKGLQQRVSDPPRGVDSRHHARGAIRARERPG